LKEKVIVYENVYLLPVTPKHKPDVCFDLCGKIIITCSVIVPIETENGTVELPCFVCKEDKCEFEEKRLFIGQIRLFNKTYNGYLRRVKQVEKK